ncbi:hypothetical protein HYV30_03335 [Candidatus Kaiserbacteria bacterium]|nr:hypothetical protein [Candidatus Kaiserbacteria bacterium]
MFGRIGLATAFGGGIGAFIALQLGVFWPLGAFAGGVAAWAAYDLRALLAAIPVAWQCASSPEMRRFGRLLWGTTCVIGSYLIPFAAGFALLAAKPKYQMWVTAVFIMISAIASISFALLWTCAGVDLVSADDQIRRCWRYNSIVLLVRFARHLFVLVHSEMRLLCFCDTALGAAIGYYLGHAVFGALAGGLLGVAHYAVAKYGLHLAPSGS